MKLSQLLSRIDVKNSYTDCEVSGITDKFDDIKKGNIFVCIKGMRFDAHTLAEKAISEKGASAVIVEKETSASNQVIVNNSREAYTLLCAAWFDYPTEKLKMIGITGTNGKTTTAFLIKGILDKCSVKAGLLGTVKNLVGDKEYPAKLTTPDPFEMQELFAEMVKEKCVYCVMEVSSQALSQKRVAGIDFELGLFTNLTEDHLDYHGTMEEYKKAKHILFENCKTAIINDDDDAAEFMKSNIGGEVITFSAKQNNADFIAKNIVLRDSGVSYEFIGNETIGRIKLDIPGGFTVYNSMGAVIACLKCGIELDKVISVLGEESGVSGRMETVKTDTDYTVIIDYAHTPDGLENVLKTLRTVYKGRVITVFGCGGDRDSKKRPIMGEIAGELSHIAIVTSDNPRSENPDKIIEDILEGMKKAKAKVIVQSDRTKAIEKALSLAKAGDVVLLAGKGHETYQILSTGKIHYDEREVIKNILREK